MKELQKSFKELLSLEIRARDLYLGILGQDIGDEETNHQIGFIKNQELGHIIMARELIKISQKAELRKSGFHLSQKTLNSLKGDITFKRILLNGIIKLLDAKTRTFALLGFLGKEAIKFKKTDKARQELTKIIAHQLKTPLTVSSWIAESLLRRKEKLTENEKEIVEEIRSQNKTMFSLVDDLLEADRVEEIEKKEKVNLVKITKETLGGLEYLIKNKKQEVVSQYFKDEIVIFSEEKSLRKIISNLLTNAVNYGKKEGKIFISVKRLGANKILFSVSDDGIGIPLKEQKNIFKKFFRASNAKDLYQKGTGLGLYIVKELTKKLGGRVWFESKESKGATFYVKLPI